MKIKNFEDYAKRAETFNSVFEGTVKEAADNMTKVSGDWRFSDKGKAEKKRELIAELNTNASNLTDIFKGAVKAFCDDFSIQLPEDGADHGKDIENALRVIDMLGFSLDEKNLANIIEPLKGSFRSMKMIFDIIDTKQKSALENGSSGFSTDVVSKLYSYMGINTSVMNYIDALNNLKTVSETPGSGYRFIITSYPNAPVTRIQAAIPYEFLACADWMREVGEQYADLEGEFSSLFKDHVQTHEEMIADVLAGK